MSLIKNLLSGKWYVIIAPPSLYITRRLTKSEANNLIAQFGNRHKIVLDISGRFTKRYLTKSYPITNPFGK